MMRTSRISYYGILHPFLFVQSLLVNIIVGAFGFVIQEVPPTPGQQVKVPMFIPLAVGLLDSNGKGIPLMSVYHEGLLESLTPNAHPVDIVVLQVKKPIGIKLGTLMGLFVPCLQNIMGIIHFIRFSWIVGMASILDSLLLVSFCGMCTFLTTLSLSAIATNGAIKNLLINGSNLCTAGITGLSSTTFKDNLSSEFQHTNNAGVPDPNGSIYWNFNALVSLFFPAVIGIMAGSNRLSSLKDTEHSIRIWNPRPLLLRQTVFIFNLCGCYLELNQPQKALERQVENNRSIELYIFDHANISRRTLKNISLGESPRTTSRRLADRKVEKFEKNITKRGAVPETTAKKGADYPVTPIVLGFFVFVVIGSWLSISLLPLLFSGHIYFLLAPQGHIDLFVPNHPYSNKRRRGLIMITISGRLLVKNSRLGFC
ncbi:hypothetical protein IFM89_006533 [Coptis chinensis]|uniref:Amino acid permease/ SLC12A domain-containing protein n=1 Tax=Coptis chinensis TaxID=261450 RepID=A0A835MD37_9MAGN|nr:hypothetical protein IFM89_006533 [Coptis chinensis]